MIWTSSRVALLFFSGCGGVCGLSRCLCQRGLAGGVSQGIGILGGRISWVGGRVKRVIATNSQGHGSSRVRGGRGLDAASARVVLAICRVGIRRVNRCI